MDETEDETEFTIAIIKPDAVVNRQIGAIITAIEAEIPHCSFEILGMDTFREREAVKFYAEHKGKPFFNDLIAHTISGPSVFIAIDGTDVIAKWRAVCGATDPAKAAPATLRARFGTTGPANAVHGSATQDDAIAELCIVQELLGID